MSTLSITNYDNKVLDKFFSRSSYVETKSNFKNFNSVVKFVSHLKKKDLLDDQQLRELLKYSISMYIENEIEYTIENQLFRSWSRMFEMLLDKEEEESLVSLESHHHQYLKK